MTVREATETEGGKEAHRAALAGDIDANRRAAADAAAVQVPRLAALTVLVYNRWHQRAVGERAAAACVVEHTARAAVAEVEAVAAARLVAGREEGQAAEGLGVVLERCKSELEAFGAVVAVAAGVAGGAVAAVALDVAGANAALHRSCARGQSGGQRWHTAASAGRRRVGTGLFHGCHDTRALAKPKHVKRGCAPTQLQPVADEA